MENANVNKYLSDTDKTSKHACTNLRLYGAHDLTPVRCIRTYSCTVRTTLRLYGAYKLTPVRCIRTYACTVRTNLRLYGAYELTPVRCVRTYACTVHTNSRSDKHTHTTRTHMRACCVCVIKSVSMIAKLS